MSVRISSSILPSQLASRFALHFPPGDSNAMSADEIWMNVLKFPMESSNPIGDSERLLDPISVISRMLAIRANMVYEADDSSASNHTYPLSWALRISEDLKSGAVLGMLRSMAHDQGQEEFEKIIDNVFELFPDLAIDNNGDHKASKEKIEACMEELRDGLMIHVSSPHFHDFWSYLEKLSDLENENDLLRNAKEHWSISLPIMMERAALAQEREGFFCLQSGGGHLLVFKSGSSVASPEDHVLEILGGMKDWFEDGGNLEWSPPLSASYYYGVNNEKRGWRALTSTLIGEKELAKEALEALHNSHESAKERRKIDDIKGLWAPFGGPTRRKLQATQDNEARIYMDFIGLGDKCWPKPKQGSSDDLSDEDYEDGTQILDYKHLRARQPRDFAVLKDLFELPFGIPVRPSEGGPIEGFKRSLVLTGFIESTIGAVISNVYTTKIHTLGGDEIEADIDPRDFHLLIEAIEKHSLDYYMELRPTADIELSWWLACFNQQELGAGFERTIKAAKDEYRPTKVGTANSSIGPLDMGTKFVHVIWSEYLGQINTNN